MKFELTSSGNSFWVVSRPLPREKRLTSTKEINQCNNNSDRQFNLNSFQNVPHCSKNQPHDVRSNFILEHSALSKVNKENLERLLVCNRMAPEAPENNRTPLRNNTCHLHNNTCQIRTILAHTITESVNYKNIINEKTSKETTRGKINVGFFWFLCIFFKQSRLWLFPRDWSL